MKKVVPADSILIPDNATQVFQGEIFGVYQWEQPLFDGSPATFEMLRRPDTVNVLALVDGKIIVLDDEQPHTGSRKSLPGGRVDETDASIEAAAQREVLEETGYQFKNWRLIRVQQPHGKLEWFVYLLLAWEVESQQEPSLDAGEKITADLLTLDELKKLAFAGEGHLGELAPLLEAIDNIDQLLVLPPYTGRTIER